MTDIPPPYLNSMGRYLGFAMQEVQALTNRKLEKYELTLPQWIALTALWREDGLTVSALAKYTRSKTPATSRLLCRMEKQGLIKRKMAKGNRRAVNVWLTPKSQKLSHLLNLYRDINDTILKEFSDNEKIHLQDYLTRITKNAETYKNKRP